MKWITWASQHIEKNTMYKIHSVYKKTVNVCVEDRILAIHPDFIEMTPLSVSIPLSLEDFQEFAEQAKIWKYIMFEKDFIYVGDKRWDVMDENVWNPTMETNCRLEEIDLLYKEIEKYILKEGTNLEGMADSAVNTQKKETDSLINRFLREYTSIIYETGLKNPQKLVDIAKKMIGLGIGLTPSGDDFVAGLLISFCGIQSEFQKEKLYFQKNIEPFFKETNDISRQYLKCASRGEAGLPWHRLLMQPSDVNKINNNLAQIRRIGHSSGVDTLNGIYVGMKLMKGK